MAAISKMRKWIVRFAIFILILILIPVFVIFTFTGPLVKYAVEYWDTEWTGREILLGDSRINLFTGNIDLSDLIIFEKDSAETFIRLNSLHLDGNVWPILSKKLEIDKLALEGLNVRIEQDGARFNFDDLVQRFSSPDTISVPPVDSTEAPPWSMNVTNASLFGAKVDFYNRIIENRIVVDSIRVECPAYDSEKGIVPIKFGCVFAETASGMVNADLVLDQNSLDYKGAFNLEQVSFAPLYRYLTEYLNIGSLNGALTAALQLEGTLSGQQHYSGSGVLSVDGFELTDPAMKAVSAFSRLEIEVDTMDSQHKNYHFSALRLTKPYIRFELYPKGDNLSALVREDIRTPDTVITRIESDVIPGQEYFNVFIYLGQYANYLARTYVESDYIADRIEIRDGTILFQDMTMQENVTFLLEEIEVRSTKFDSRNDHVNISLSTLVNQGAVFDAKWSVDPRDVLEMDLDYTLKGLSIASLSPYSVFHTAHPLVSGKMLFEGNVSIHDRQVGSRNHLYIEDVDVAKKKFRDPPIKLPLRLAVILLRDVRGNIDLDLPVSGSLDDPKFHYGRIIWQVFRNLIIKAAAAPVKLLAKQFGVKEDELKEIPYAYGEASPADSSRYRKVARILKKKPDLILKYYPKGNAEIEKDLMAFDIVQRIYTDSLRSMTGDSTYAPSPEELSPRDSVFNAFILRRSGHENWDAPVQVHCRTIVGEARLEMLYDSIESIRQMSFLRSLTEVNGVPAQRIQLWDPGKEVVRDTINLPRPTVLLKFDVD